MKLADRWTLLQGNTRSRARDAELVSCGFLVIDKSMLRLVMFITTLPPQVLFSFVTFPLMHIVGDLSVTFTFSNTTGQIASRLLAYYTSVLWNFGLLSILPMVTFCTSTQSVTEVRIVLRQIHRTGFSHCSYIFARLHFIPVTSETS